MVLETIGWLQNVRERSRKVLEVLQMCPECPETVPVCPGRSRKLLEGHGRFRKVPGSTTHSPAPLALGGKPPRLPWPAKGRGAHQGEGILLQVESPTLQYGRFPVGRFGRFWESKLDSPPPLLRPKGLLATYIMWGRGG